MVVQAGQDWDSYNDLCFPKIISERNGGAGRTRLG
jgi:hypothetical protein